MVNRINGFEWLKDLTARLEVERERIEAEARYLKRGLWDHAKVGLQFQPGAPPGVVENAERAHSSDEICKAMKVSRATCYRYAAASQA
jgi:hypothetical protein